MFVITGGSGFIGSNLAKGLEENYSKPIFIVDWIKNKEKNINKRKNITLVDPKKYLLFLNQNVNNIEIIFHLGAITSTTEKNAKRITKHNLDLSLNLWKWCISNNVRFIYASSAATYGSGQNNFKDIDKLSYLSSLEPLNLYGWSKHLFDKFVVNQVSKSIAPPQWVGLKFFNVYGPNEYHKGEMKSIICKIYERISTKKDIFLFKSHKKKFKDGEQLRDFIYVKDVVKVICWLVENPCVNGIFNLGSGKARTFKDLAYSVFKCCNHRKEVKYINTPSSIKDKYQYYTKAHMSKLLDAGYNNSFTELEDGVKDYVQNFLLKKDKYN